MRRIWESLLALIGKEGVEAEMDEELRFHLGMETKKNIRKGMNPTEARRQAMIAFGGVDRFKEKTREERGVRPMENFLQDVRYALRQLRTNPGFALVAVLTLALGIGATTVVFSVFNTVVLRPLPFHEAHRLVRVRELTPQGDPMSVSDANFLDFREQNRSFQEMVAVFSRSLVLTREDEPVQLGGMAATEGMFRMLGVSPVAGRDFLPQDFTLGEEPGTVILGNGFWVREFGSDPNLVGEMVILDGIPRMVVGVLPDLEPPFSFDVWLPYTADPNFPRGDHRREVFARLAPGVSTDQVLSDLNQIQARIGEAFPESNEGWEVWIRTLPEWVVGPEVTRIAQVLLGAVGLLLLLACVSVSNLLVARGTTRQREISLRAALGAGRSRLLSQLVVEGLVLAGLGTGLGILIAYWTLPLIQALESTPLPRLDQVILDRTALVFAIVASLLSALVFSAAPALQGSRADLMDLMRTGGRMVSRSSQRLRDGLVAGQLALAMVLLVGAGLLVSSFFRMTSVDPGFDAENVLLAQISLPADRYPEMSPQVGNGYRQILASLEATPGVAAAGATMARPTMTLVIRANGDPASVAAQVREAVWSVEDGLPVPQITFMEEALGGALSAPRRNMLLMGIFSASALLLAAVALYGITAFAVARRTREIGVRMALGAPKGEVVGMVLKKGLALVVVGSAVGLVGAFLLTRFMESLLFEVDAMDALTYGVVSGLMAAVTLVATLIPARKALKVDPTIALQAE